MILVYSSIARSFALNASLKQSSLPRLHQLTPRRIRQTYDFNQQFYLWREWIIEPSITNHTPSPPLFSISLHSTENSLHFRFRRVVAMLHVCITVCITVTKWDVPYCFHQVTAVELNQRKTKSYDNETWLANYFLSALSASDAKILFHMREDRNISNWIIVTNKLY